METESWEVIGFMLLIRCVGIVIYTVVSRVTAI